MLASGTTDATPKTKRRRRSSGGGAGSAAPKELKKVYKLIVSSVSQVLALTERIERLVNKVPLDDQTVVTLCSSAMTVFAIEPSTVASDNTEALTHLLQVAAIGLLTAICRRYPQHRSILVEDIFPLLLQLPTGKRHLRRFVLASAPGGNPTLGSDTGRRPAARRLFAGDQSESIQAITVLILSMIQSCVVRPQYAVVSATGQRAAHVEFQSGTAQSQAFCDMFVAHLLQRCSKKGEEGGASEYRPILNNLVDDLLAVQLVPEFPASEMLLQTICRYLGNDLMKASSSGGSKSKTDVESTYLTTGFDVLGKITASMADLLARHRQRPLSINHQAVSDADGGGFGSTGGQDDSPGSTLVNNCFCGRRHLVDTFMLNCDRCRGWFHGECVGVTKDMIDEVWYCADCQLKQMAINETKAFAARSPRFSTALAGVFDDNATSKVPAIVETHVFRQLVLKYLTQQEEHTDAVSLDTAREFLLARWIQDVDTAIAAHNKQQQSQANMDDGGISDEGQSEFDPDLLSKHLFQLWENPHMDSLCGSSQYPQNRNDTVSLLNKEGYTRLTTALAATTSEHVLFFPRRIGLLMQLMSDNNLVSLRKLAIKAITQVIASDQTLMVLPSLKKAVRERFRDSAKSVREAVVGLVGSYVVLVPEVADAFHSSLLPCLSDEGVSVRKRTIRIYRDVLVSNPSFAGRAEVCTVMLARAVDPKEDDTVRDLIHDLFTELWLENTAIPTGTVKRPTSTDPNVKSEGDDSLADTGRDRQETVAGLVTPTSKDDWDVESGMGGRNNKGHTEQQQLQQQQEQGSATAVSSDNAASSVKKARRTPLMRSESSLEARCRVASQHMIEVVQTSDSKEGLSELLKSLLSDVNDADKSKRSTERQQRKATLRMHCSHLVEALIEHLLRLEERRTRKKQSLAKELIATLRTMAVFAEVSPADLLEHLDTLLPYLKASNGLKATEEAEVVVEVCDVIARVSVVMMRRDVLSLSQGSLCDDIVKITYRFGSAAIGSSVKVLCRLAEHCEMDPSSEFASKLLKVAKTFYSYLRPLKDNTNDFSKTGVSVIS